MYYPTIKKVKQLRTQGNIVPVYREIIADLETPVSAYLKVARNGFSFLLESVTGGDRVARYSFIATEPYGLIRTDVNGINDPLELVSRELDRYRYINVPGLPRFSGGAVGYLSYELVHRLEKISIHKNDILDLPEAIFMLVRDMLVFDHVTRKIKVISHVLLDGDTERAYDEAIKRIDKLIERLANPLDCSKAIRESAGINEEINISSNFTPEEYKNGVRKIKQYIIKGEAIQVVLSQRFECPTFTAPFEIYRALRTINPSPYMFYFDFKDFQIVGASPEILVRVEEGTVMTRPLAGTRSRGKSGKEDKELEEELKADKKEQAEHIMLVDLGRNDIGRVCVPGSVKVSDLMEVERYSHVMHLVTQVQGKLAEKMSNYETLRACFPAGTVSGAPKIRAMEIIAELEKEQRGPYAGAAGYFSFTGNMDMAIAIRTMVVKNKIAYVQSGAGIVYDSDPNREYIETKNKALAMLTAIRQAEVYPISEKSNAADY